ncbi:hypothetical protein FRC08_007511 [Ceratobasidium sp. 394]|nr:hypothetical protein FRC08_007511 [Ceratobasidium sp. 394]
MTQVRTAASPLWPHSIVAFMYHPRRLGSRRISFVRLDQHNVVLCCETYIPLEARSFLHTTKPGSCTLTEDTG